MLEEVSPTVDPDLDALVHDELDRQGVNVHTRITVTAPPAPRPSCTSRLEV